MEFVDEVKTHVSCQTSCFQKLFRLRDNYDKYGIISQATDDVTKYDAIKAQFALRLVDTKIQVWYYII
jgi:hypothetical protein